MALCYMAKHNCPIPRAERPGCLNEVDSEPQKFRPHHADQRHPTEKQHDEKQPAKRGSDDGSQSIKT